MKSPTNRRRLIAALLLALPLTVVSGVGVAAAQEPTPAAAPCPDEGATTAAAPGEGAGAAAVAAQPAIKVWMAGDSTMANASKCPIGWGKEFGPLLNSNATVVNSAVAGRSIQTWLYEKNVTNNKDAAGECVVSPDEFHSRWKAMLDPNTGMKAGDFLVIQFGINDGHPDCPRHVGGPRFRELLNMMTKAALDRGANPILVTPVSGLKCEGSVAVGNRGYLTEIAAVAGARKGSRMIDLHRHSYTLYNTLKFCPHNGDWSSGPVGAFFCQDRTHFEQAGARQIALLIAKALRDQKIPLRDYLK